VVAKRIFSPRDLSVGVSSVEHVLVENEVLRLVDEVGAVDDLVGEFFTKGTHD